MVHAKADRKLYSPGPCNFLPYHEYTVMDTHITGQLIGSLGYLISRCDHSRKTAFPSLLFIVFCVSHLEDEKRK